MPDNDLGQVRDAITAITRTSGTGAPGTVDTYTIYTECSPGGIITPGLSPAGTFQVVNGENGTSGVITSLPVQASQIDLVGIGVKQPDTRDQGNSKSLYLSGSQVKMKRYIIHKGLSGGSLTPGQSNTVAFDAQTVKGIVILANADLDYTAAGGAGLDKEVTVAETNVTGPSRTVTVSLKITATGSGGSVTLGGDLWAWIYTWEVEDSHTIS